MSKAITALCLALALGAVAGAGAASRPTQEPGTRIATVVKVRGLAWFERMRDGIEQFATRRGIDTTFRAGRPTPAPRNR